VSGAAADRPLLGIVGGMGPLASAELLATIYRHDPPAREQDAPRCLLLSDPTFPDRTEALLRGETAELTRRLAAAIASLLDQGAARVVIACFTIHRVLPELPAALRAKVVSLVDLVVEEVAAGSAEGRGPHLLLATAGSYRAGVFTSHPRWPEVAPSVRLLGEADREALHERLYRLKRGEPAEQSVAFVQELRERYGTPGAIFGCTELHLLQRHLGEGDREGVVDPLMTLARRFDEIAAGTYPPALRSTAVLTSTP
jgi:aspartate racemase